MLLDATNTLSLMTVERIKNKLKNFLFDKNKLLKNNKRGFMRAKEVKE